MHPASSPAGCAQPLELLCGALSPPGSRGRGREACGHTPRSSKSAHCNSKEALILSLLKVCIFIFFLLLIAGFFLLMVITRCMPTLSLLSPITPRCQRTRPQGPWRGCRSSCTCFCLSLPWLSSCGLKTSRRGRRIIPACTNPPVSPVSALVTLPPASGTHGHPSSLCPSFVPFSVYNFCSPLCSRSFLKVGMAQRLNERRHSSCELFPAWGGRTDGAEASRKPCSRLHGPPR